MNNPQLAPEAEALAACPFCAKTDRLIVKPYRFTEDGGEPFDWGFVVQCSAVGIDGSPQRGCGASSGWGETRVEAIDVWNRRAPGSTGAVAPEPRKQFPILSSGGQKIDWALVADHGRQAQANHYQSVERLAQRGGLSWPELYAVLHNKPFQKKDENEALLACRMLEARYLAALSPAPADTGQGGRVEELKAALRAAEAAAESIRLTLINHLHEPERQAFWAAVYIRDLARAALNAGART